MTKKEHLDIFFDIDGVVCLETEGHDYENRTPITENIKIIQQLYQDRSKYRIVFFTSRYQIDEKVTKEWFSVNKVPYDDIIFGKPKFDWFIDDKALNVSDLKKYFGWELQQ